MENNSIIIFSILGLVVFSLAIYLGILLNKLKTQNIYFKKKKIQDEKKKVERIKYISESLRIIALAVTQDQCEVSEGCIRIKKLIDELDHLKDLEVLNYFHKAYEDFKEFPFLDARKELTKQEKFTQDNKRFLLEEQHGLQVKKACSELLILLKNEN